MTRPQPSPTRATPALALRAAINRVRRRLARLLWHRMVFGERSQGRWLPMTRIAPSTCIEHEDRLRLGDHVYIGPFNFIEASAGVEIGEGVQITHHASIVSHASHRAQRLLGRRFADWAGPRPGWVAAPVAIGAYSFVGPHSVIEAVGTEESLRQAIRSCRAGGHIGFVGVAHKGVTIPADELFFAEVHLHGGPAPVRRYLPELIQLIWDRTINPGKVFDLTLPLADAAQGYAAMDQRTATKVLLTTN